MTSSTSEPAGSEPTPSSTGGDHQKAEDDDEHPDAGQRTGALAEHGHPESGRGHGFGEGQGRYGPDPSSEDRDVIIPPYVGMRPWADGATGTGGRIMRRPMSVRKADEQYAIGVDAEGSAASRGTPLVEPAAFFELVPERFWPWLPVVVIAVGASIIAATVALGLALM